MLLVSVKNDILRTLIRLNSTLHPVKSSTTLIKLVINPNVINTHQHPFKNGFDSFDIL